MFSLGTGLMRIVNFVLIGVVVIGLLIAGYQAWTGRYVEKGRQEVITEVTENNRKLDRRVEEINENIVRRNITTTETIDRRSKEVEDEIRNQPSEPISNVTSVRIERVREQQRDIREASQKP